MADGQQLWRTHFDDGERDSPWHIALDEADERVFLTAVSENPASDATGFATAAYDAVSGEQLWRDRYEGDLPDGLNVPTALTLDGDRDRVFVSGLATNTRRADYDFATVAYDGASGARLWVANTGGVRDERVWDTAVSDDGSSLYLTGRSGAPYVTGPSGGSGTDLATVAYDAATGGRRWAARYNGDSPTQVGGDPVFVAPTPDGTRVVTTGSMKHVAGLPPGVVAMGYDER
jgi:hypothetical protein